MLEFIIYGLIHEGDWDLTQPQATLLAGVISGVLLIAAAYIAFHGQREQRREEGRRHMELLKAQREQLAIQQTQFDDQLRVQREGWAADNKANSDRAYREEVRQTYKAAIRALRDVHIQTDEFHRAKQEPSDKDVVMRIRAEVKLAVQELMVLDEELVMVNSDEVRKAYSAAVTRIEINGGMDNPNESAITRVSEDFDFQKGESLITALAVAMGKHLDSLRPI